jgi:hypothetical protein
VHELCIRNLSIAIVVEVIKQAHCISHGYDEHVPIQPGLVHLPLVSKATALKAFTELE